ncbi:hypothetical protein AK812_SmicGene28980 [Symbiodinium microadriaticum]|uniref:Protein kinase domain-containing protein n=1 Tax=Symbiodinium microadriaticum TaxID=2951 RepID=A0A1Q9D317_SYMMI|nr:hypothetical protein AK812_SmicGene28980 [Symbiodinium microadriaticum]
MFAALAAEVWKTRVASPRLGQGQSGLTASRIIGVSVRLRHLCERRLAPESLRSFFSMCPKLLASLNRGAVWGLVTSASAVKQALFLGRVRLLDRQTVTSIDDAVDSLNRRLVWCPEDGCAVFNAADRSIAAAAASRTELSLIGETEAQSIFQRSSQPGGGKNGAPGQSARWVAFADLREVSSSSSSVTGPPARGSFGASPTGEVLRQNSLAAQGMLQFPQVEELPQRELALLHADKLFRAQALKYRRYWAFPGWSYSQLTSVSARFASPVRPAGGDSLKIGDPDSQRPKLVGCIMPRSAGEINVTTSQPLAKAPIKVRYGELTFVERLGKGEFGEVFRGLYLNKEVAIKQLFFDENMTELVVQDLAREIDSFRHLSHKRLVGLGEVFFCSPLLLAISTFDPQGKLRDLAIASPLALHPRYLHSQTPTIVHRDLKSLNVVLDLSLNIKLVEDKVSEPAQTGGRATATMGCSQSSTVAEAKAQQHSTHAHAFPTKEAMSKLRDAPKQVKSTKSTLSEASASEAAAVDKLADLRRCVLQVGDNRMVECDEPSVQQDYNSWKHEVDAQDLKALKEGHAVPVNRTADQHLAKKMKSSLSELTEDPSKLKRAVQLRRMDREEIAAYRNVLSLNGVEGSKEDNKQAKSRERTSQPKPSL